MVASWCHFIDKEPNRQKAVAVCLFSHHLTNNLFSFCQSRSATEIGSGVLDTEEMDAGPVKGKSFISVDPLGQVD